MFDAVPAPLLVLFAIVTIQVGAAIAIGLFPVLGAEGTVAIRIIISAFLLGFVARKRLLSYPKLIALNWGQLLLFGACIAAMNLFFYMAIARIPLGAAVSIEFIGPLGVAAVTSRKLIHFVFVGLAFFGIYLLSPLSGVVLDPIGIGFALLAGIGWASFMVMASKIGRQVSGNDGLVIGMIVAAVLMLPIAMPVAGEFVKDPMLLLIGLAVALLSTTLPFTLEFEALKRIPMRTYGILVSVEPAFAAMVGALFLGQQLGLQGMIAVGFVVVAAVGISLTDSQTHNSPD